MVKQSGEPRDDNHKKIIIIPRLQSPEENSRADAFCLLFLQSKPVKGKPGLVHDSFYLSTKVKVQLQGDNEYIVLYEDGENVGVRLTDLCAELFSKLLPEEKTKYQLLIKELKDEIRECQAKNGNDRITLR